MLINAYVFRINILRQTVRLASGAFAFSMQSVVQINGKR